jgi:translocation and assembly module TamB
LKKLLKIVAYCLLGLLLFLFGLILLIRTPWAQQKITNYAVGYLAGKTETKVAIERLFITFAGNVQLEGLYLADTNGDTLVYLGSLNTGLSLKSLYKGSLVISHVEIKELTANVHNENADSTFNYQFIIDAFAKEEGQAVESEEKESGHPPSLTIGKIALSSINLRYVDVIEGMETSGNIGQLIINPDEIDLGKLIFHLKSINIDQTELA